MASDVPANGIAIDERNILVNLKVANRTEAICRLGGLLYDNGYVKETYVQAVLDREEIFPTGLQTTLLGMAIPHTDTEHVIHPSIAIATLKEPVIFQGMGMPDLSIPVKIVMMLAIHDPKKVVNTLRSVISILENEPVLKALIKATSKNEIKEIVGNHIQEMAKVFSSEAISELKH
jgi:PTS system galactitol-specific IIA component